jgi:hypothetical protein
VEPRGGDAFAELAAALRATNEAVTATAAPGDVLLRAAAALRLAVDELAGHEAADGEQHAGFRLDLPDRGHPLLAPFLVDELADDRVTGRVTLARTHLSGGGHAHAGAVALLFGEVLGVLSVLGGRAPARNASLRVDYRKGTPAGRELQVTGAVVRVDGRKITVAGELRDGELLLAEAEGLYLKVKA